MAPRSQVLRCKKCLFLFASFRSCVGFRKCHKRSAAADTPPWPQHAAPNWRDRRTRRYCADIASDAKTVQNGCCPCLLPGGFTASCTVHCTGAFHTPSFGALWGAPCVLLLSKSAPQVQQHGCAAEGHPLLRMGPSSLPATSCSRGPPTAQASPSSLPARGPARYRLARRLWGGTAAMQASRLSCTAAVGRAWAVRFPACPQPELQ